ncbi:MFS transporter [Comamonas serinivorans]|uniref:MFS transporter n=1 Tax=Comamonas serinivorans TaxID=1082851 RepID=A0A1Y0EN89_9BURK|nr:MFS transporter [Comamonas serinivorans]ARU04901.1 MFS transporter [Comamonas serinivorans]
MTGAELLRLVIAQVCIHATMAGLRLATPLLALQEGYQPGAVGTLVALFAVSQVFLAVPAGKFADRHGIRLPLGMACVAAAVPLVAGAAFPIMPVLCVGALLTGGAAGATIITLQRHIGRAAQSPQERTKFFSWLAIAPAAANFVGPFGAGLLIDYAGHQRADELAFRICLGALACLPVIAWLLVMRARELPREPAHAHAGKTHAWDLLREVSFRRILFVNWLQAASWDIHAFIVPILGHDRGLSASAIGGILGAFAISAAAIRVVLPAIARRVTPKQLIFVATCVTACLFSVYPFTHHAWQMTVCAMCLGVSLGCVQPMIMSLMHQTTPPHRQGEALGLRLMAINASSVVMPMVAGSLGSLIGAGAVFWVVAVVVGSGTSVIRKLDFSQGQGD